MRNVNALVSTKHVCVYVCWLFFNKLLRCLLSKLLAKLILYMYNVEWSGKLSSLHKFRWHVYSSYLGNVRQNIIYGFISYVTSGCVYCVCVGGEGRRGLACVHYWYCFAWFVCVSVGGVFSWIWILYDFCSLFNRKIILPHLILLSLEIQCARSVNVDKFLNK